MSQSPVFATNPPRVAVLIVAAGRGVRAGGGLPKQYRKIGDKSLLTRSIAAFAGHPKVQDIRVAIHADDHALYEEAAAGFDILPPVHGGASRQASVRAGLESFADTDPDIVLIHDAARCFVDEALISRVVDAITPDCGAIPGLPVTDTLKRTEGNTITGTVSRDNLYRAQTPQGFPFQRVLQAHKALADEDLTDDAALAERVGLAVQIVEGDERNKKVTMASDFRTAANTPALQEPRTAMGFDVHRFEPGDHVWLCGVKIPHTRKLKGHSDADVGLHALTDAILGTICDGDIGTHFPPSDPKWKGAASDRFLAHAARLVREKEARIAHCDVTLICEAPKIGPHKEAMRQRIAEILTIAPSRISVKATTTEKLGFTGRGEGIAAQAIATVLVPSNGEV